MNGQSNVCPRETRRAHVLFDMLTYHIELMPAWLSQHLLLMCAVCITVTSVCGVLSSIHALFCVGRAPDNY